MFNSYSGGNYNSSMSMTINAVSGAILKNHPKSWFERFNLESERAKKLLIEGGHRAHKKRWVEHNHMQGCYVSDESPENDIIVLQMVICGDMEVLAECIYRKDYEAYNDTYNGGLEC